MPVLSSRARNDIFGFRHFAEADRRRLVIFIQLDRHASGAAGGRQQRVIRLIARAVKQHRNICHAGRAIFYFDMERRFGGFKTCAGKIGAGPFAQINLLAIRTTIDVARAVGD